MSKPTKDGSSFPSSVRHGWTVLLRLFGAGGLGMILVSGWAGCISTAGDQKMAAVAEKPAAATSRAGDKQSLAPAKQQATDPQALTIQELSAREESGQTILFLKLSQPVKEFRHFPLPQPSRIVLDLLGNIKAVPLKEIFRVDTNWVATVRLTVEENSFRLVADVTAARVPEYTITPDEGGLRIVIGEHNAKAMARKSFTFVRNGKRVDIQSLGVEGSSSSESQQASGSVTDQPGGREKTYIGQKITLEFKDADIKNIFRLLGEVSGRNLVVTDDVNRKVTMRLVEVPWDQALDLIIETNGLAKEEVGNVTRISTAARITAEKRAIQDTRKAAQGAEISRIWYLNVNYAKGKDLVDRVKQVIKSGAEVVADDRSNVIIVRGTEQDWKEIAAIVSRLDVRAPQVLIESNLIETTPSFARALGNRLTFQLGGTTFSGAAPAGAPFQGNTAVFPSLPTGLGATIAVIQNHVGGFKNLANSLEAAETEGNIRIISRPSVVTLNNVASTIRSERILRILLPASTNIATGTGSSAAGAAVATEKVPVGITLTVTPQVSSDGYVLMNINVKSSSLGSQSQGSVIPDELSREATSHVLVRDGETIVLGGILKDTTQESESGIPYLKDIPVLGWLFKSHRWQKDFEELMVFITPRVTAAGSANLPTAEQLWREQMKLTEGPAGQSRTPAP